MAAFVSAGVAISVIDPELLRFLSARILLDERGFANALLGRIRSPAVPPGKMVRQERASTPMATEGTPVPIAAVKVYFGPA